MADDVKTQNLSIFLAREGVLDEFALIKDQGSKDITINLPGIGNCHLYVKVGPRKPPKWVSLFEGIVDSSDIGKANGISAALTIAISDRMFVLTFGQGGRFLVKEEAIEPRFGLLVTLNSVDPKSLRCVDKQSLDNLESQSRIQSSYETSSDKFGIDVEQDMLKAVVGTPIDSKLGSRMTGSDSLSVSVKVSIENLKPLLESYFHNFKRNLSDSGYEWVNNIAGINQNSPLVFALEEKLNSKLEQRDFSNLWLSIPEIIPWDAVKGFIFTSGSKIIHPDITMEGFLSTVKDIALSVELLKSRKVSCADEEHNYIHRTWTIYRCLYVEIDHDDAKYILNDGKWFRIENDFVAKTSKDFEKLSESSLCLPKYQHHDEGAYNKFVSENFPDKYALLDDTKKVFHGGGHGQVEICDLFSNEKHLIHVKRYGKSSVLSHLFSQGFVSGQLIQLDQDFRRKVREKLPDSFKSLVAEKFRPKEFEYTVTFAIISEDESGGLHLPFFSKVNINNVSRILKGYGYNVEWLKIGVDEKYAKTTICPPKRENRRRNKG